MVDNLKDRLKPAVVLLATGAEGKISVVGGVTADLTGRVKAGDLVGFVAGQVGGKGGGRPDMAMGGGTDAAACRRRSPACRSGWKSVSDGFVGRTGRAGRRGAGFRYGSRRQRPDLPLPILRAKKALAQMESGQVLRVVTTDRNAVRDFQAFSRQTGNAARAAGVGRRLHAFPAQTLGGERVPPGFVQCRDVAFWRAVCRIKRASR